MVRSIEDARGSHFIPCCRGKSQENSLSGSLACFDDVPKISGKSQISVLQLLRGGIRNGFSRRVVDRHLSLARGISPGRAHPTADRAAKTRHDREYELLDASVRQYNRIAKEVLRDMGVPINDLYTSLSEPGNQYRVPNKQNARTVRVSDLCLVEPPHTAYFGL